MSDFALSGGNRSLSAGFVQATTDGTVITANSTANSKGAYTELLSAANNKYDSFEVEVVFRGKGIVRADFLVDISIGDAGSEQVIIQNIYTKANTVSLTNKVTFPLSIPAGVRVSARCQCDISSGTLGVYVVLTDGNFKQGTGFSEVISYGADESTSTGTLVPRAAAGVFGSWVEIVASTSDDISALAVACARQGGSWSDGTGNYQIAVGSAGNEEIILSDMLWTTTSAETGTGLMAGSYVISIPKGQRLSVRAAATSANADFDNDFVIYGVK